VSSIAGCSRTIVDQRRQRPPAVAILGYSFDQQNVQQRQNSRGGALTLEALNCVESERATEDLTVLLMESGHSFR
jgi:hypothetical protein